MNCTQQIHQDINKSNNNNVELIESVKKKLNFKQYQATLGIGSLFYSFVGFVFKIQNDQLSDWNIPNYLFYSVVVYYIVYSFCIVDQYLVISSVFDEISKSDVASLSITVELSSSQQFEKKDFNKNLLDKLSFNNNKLYMTGFLLFISHLLYIYAFIGNETQSFIFLLIIFTGYYLNILFYSIYFMKNLFKQIMKIGNKNSIEKLTVQEQCCICLSDLEKDKIVRQYSCCSNLFHKECIESWRTVKNQCPLCRSFI